MSLSVRHAPDTRTLLGNLLGDLIQKPAGPLRRRPVLLPSRPLAERVQAALARTAGVAMGCELLLPGDFVDRLAEGLGAERLDPAWTPQGLAWRVLEALEGARARHPRLRHAAPDVRSRLALARQIGDRFDQYCHFRPSLIEAWDQGLAFNEFLAGHPDVRRHFPKGFPESAREDEDWQRGLWAALTPPGGPPHPALRLQRLAEAARACDAAALAAFHPGLEVLSTGPLPFPILRLLFALGGRVDVTLRVLLPSPHLLTGTSSRRAQLRRGDPEDPEREAHPLLARMGRQSRDFLNGLLDALEGEEGFQDVVELPCPEPEGDSLLARLQADVRAARLPEPSVRPVGEGPGSAGPLRSLRAHRCHGPRREVEVLRDELLRAFQELDDLKPEEVLILAPDLDLYGPLAESILAGGAEPRLPLALAERGLEQGEPLLKALLELLDLSTGRAALSEALALLDLPAVRLGLGEEGASALACALRTSGLTFGLDAVHRREVLGAGDDATGTWRFALDRLRAGVWLGDEPSALRGDGSAALPVAGALDGSRDGLRGALAWCETLLETLGEWRTPAPPADWAGRLERALKDLLGAERAGRAGWDVEAARSAVRALRSAGAALGARQPLDAACVADQIRAEGTEEGRRVARVAGRIALGGLKPLRALPCRVLALLGLGDAAFPRRSTAPSWDLLPVLPAPGDRDPRLEDRDLFLASLLCARDRLILTAPVRGAQGGADGALSACVEELLRAAVETALGPRPEPEAERAWRAALVLDHPLQPFSERAFLGPERSFDREGLALAEALRAPRRERPFAVAGGGRPAEAAGRGEELEALRSFFEDPASAWLRARGMAVPRDPEDPGEGDSEPADLGSGGLSRLRAELLRSELKGEPLAVERLAADRGLPLGSLGILRGEGARELARDLMARARGEGGEPLETRRLAADLGSGLVLGGVLSAGGPADAGRRGPWVVLDGWPLEKARTRWRAWLAACLAAAAEGPGGLLVLAADAKGRPQARLLELPPAGEARAALRDLWRLRDEGRTRLLPFAIETSHALAQSLAKGGEDPLAAALRQWEGSDRHPGEGSRPGLALAWRGRDALRGQGEAWRSLARAVWGPALDWWERGAEAPPEPRRSRPAEGRP